MTFFKYLYCKCVACQFWFKTAPSTQQLLYIKQQANLSVKMTMMNFPQPSVQYINTVIMALWLLLSTDSTKALYIACLPNCSYLLVCSYLSWDSRFWTMWQCWRSLLFHVRLQWETLGLLIWLTGLKLYCSLSEEEKTGQTTRNQEKYALYVRQRKSKDQNTTEGHLVVTPRHMWAWYHLPLNMWILCLSASSRVTLYS